MARILDLDPATYERHLIHGEGRTWAETNCYTDVVVELLHGLGFEPIAALPFTLTIDLDVDQWTFFKFHPGDIEELYALGIHELAPWRPLAWHVEQQVAAGRHVLVELDSFFLPDTAGTAYGLEHVKSTVAVNVIDARARVMEYFHNQGYHRLEGEDFDAIFQTGGLVHPRMLPPYIEFLKPLPRARPLRGAALVEGSLAVLKRHLRRVPAVCPFGPFKAKFTADTEWLQTQELEVFHAYSFATLRQYGACFELAATYLRWLEDAGVELSVEPRQAFTDISTRTKTLQFKLARSMMRKRPLDLSSLDELAVAWDAAIGELVARFG
jgi:hypothetical protein